MADTIKFGTDGWRGVIADDFTYDNVRRVGAAIASYVHKHEDPSKGLVVAYDTRFGSPRFAEVISEALASYGIPIRLANDYTPTPAFFFHNRQGGKTFAEDIQVASSFSGHVLQVADRTTSTSPSENSDAGCA